MEWEKLLKNSKKEWEGLFDKNKITIMVGSASCGKAAGIEEVKKEIEKEVKKHKITAKIIEVGCIGLCYLEPIVDIIKDGIRISYGNITPNKVNKLITETILHNNLLKSWTIGVVGKKPYRGIPTLDSHPMMRKQIRIALKNCGYIEPTNLYHYIARDGFKALRRVLKMSNQQVINIIKSSKLRGRGGAGFPTGKKWELCYKVKKKEKYVICNGDEGDPGAFMDRSLLEGDPYSVLEGLIIAGYTIGAKEGYVYVREEYPLAIQRVTKAIETLKTYNLLGKNIFNSNFTFTIHLKQGAGAFVCGEETALLSSLEGRRGEPKPRPPYPVDKGFRGGGTVINNVETLSVIPSIILKGGKWFSSYGITTSTGTKTFALAGKVKRRGLIEVPMGITLREIIYEVGGGILEGKKFKAVQTGGPSGGCLGEEMLDKSIDYESLQRAGSIMGSGGMIVMDETSCIVDVAHYFLSFTQKESCGKCSPCRIGTRRLKEMLEEIKKGKKVDLNKVEELANTIKLGSLCGLGRTAPNPVISTLKNFRKEYVEHIEEKKCKAGVCGI